MTVAELIDAVKDLPQDLNVMAAEETARKVIVEKWQGNNHVCIFEPWDAEFVGRDIKNILTTTKAEGSGEE